MAVSETQEQKGILDSLIEALPVLQSILPMDSVFSVSDKETILFGLPGKQMGGVSAPGTPLTPNTALYRCMQNDKKEYRMFPPGNNPFPVKVSAIPVKDKGGNIVGAMSMALSDEENFALQTVAQTIASTAEEITATTEELSGTAATLSEGLARLKSTGEGIIAEINKTNDILQFVNDIATSSNLLGLNAAIEAARAGENGRGFTVVAEEIRKMATNSAKSVNDIRAILTSIQNGVFNMVQALGDIAQLGERQAAATEQVSASMEQLASSATEIEKVAK